ncbi:hypothetical protein BH11PSE2_BH11PSE2_08370 [soil metagenome]
MLRQSLIAGAALALAAAASVVQAQAPAYKIVGHIAGPDGGWDYANFDTVGRKIYVSKGNVVIVADADNGGPATALATPAVRSHAAVPLEGDRLLITNGGANTVTIVKAADGSVLATIPTGANPDAAIYDPKSGLAFAMAHGGGGVTFIDPKTQKAVGEVMIGGDLEFAAVDGRERLYVNVENKNQIAVIDIKSRTVVGRFELAGCDAPTGLAYVAKSDLLVVACSGLADILHAADGTVAAALKIGPGADAVILDVGRSLAFIPSGGDGTLAVINVADAKAVKLVQTVTTQRGARTGTVDPKTGRLYLPTAKYAAAATPGGRPTIQPGSFELLVVGP